MQQRLENYLQLCGNMLLPCVLFVIGLFTYLWSSSLGYDNGVVFHYLFLAANALLLLAFINFNQGRLLFFTIVIFVAYMAINYLRHCYGINMVDSLIYSNVITLLPLNLCLFYLKPARHFIEKKSFIYLLIIALEYAVIENLSHHNVGMAWRFYGINIIAIAAFIPILLISFIRSVAQGNLFDYGMFFAALSTALGICYSTDAVGFSLFFLLSVTIIMVIFFWQLVYRYYFNEITGLYNLISYRRHSRNFPPKYSLGIISIDGFEGLRRGLTIRQRHELVILTINAIQQHLTEDMTIYQIDDAKFIIICEKMNLKETRHNLEDIRRHIAGLEFLLHRHPVTIKITISGGVAEKKRTDTGVKEVYARAEKSMNDTLKFSGNIISPVPRSERR